MKLGLVLITLVAVASGCFEGRKTLPSGYVEEHGTYSVPTSPPETFTAVVSALESRGFPISVTREDLGVIETHARLNDVRAVHMQNEASLETSGDGWKIYIEPTPTGSRVLAYPKRYYNGQEQGTFFLSDLGPMWNELFTAIDAYLPRTPTVAGHR